MRKDIAKVVVERPRVGGGRLAHEGTRGNLNLKGYFNTEGEDGLDHRKFLNRDIELGGVRKRWSFRNYDRKQFTDFLTPLYGWLRNQAGRSWPDAYSEAKQLLRGGGVAQDHVLDHLLDNVWLLTEYRWFQSSHGRMLFVAHKSPTNKPTYPSTFYEHDFAAATNSRRYRRNPVMVVLPDDPKMRLVPLPQFLRDQGVKPTLSPENQQLKNEAWLRKERERLSTVVRDGRTYRFIHTYQKWVKRGEYKTLPLIPGYWVLGEWVQVPVYGYARDPSTHRYIHTITGYKPELRTIRRVGNRERKTLKLPQNPFKDFPTS